MKDLLVKLKDALSREENFAMIFMGACVGLMGGYGAIAFRKLIAFFTDLGWGSFTGMHGQELLTMAMAAPFWVRVLVPAVGGFFVGAIVFYFAHEAKGHGVPEVMEAVALRDGRMRIRLIVAKSFASAMCIGSGGSVGREGPIVQIGSAIGSAAGQLFKMDGDRLKTMVACGAAAGIAATFNAPMAGTLFALEVILRQFASAQFIPIMVSSVVATAISRYYLGNFPAFQVTPYDLHSYGELPLYLVLGILAGVVAHVFTKVLYGMEDFFEDIKMPALAKPFIGGAIIGCMGIFFPQIYGVGYETITQVLQENLLGLTLVALLAAKILATSMTIGSGGSGGIFAPSLFMGAVLGGAFGSAVHGLFPMLTATPGAYALVGMGAVVAGTTRAPVAAVLIIFEMTSDYHIILPLMFACTFGLVISTLLSSESIYTMKLVRRGVNIFAGKDLNVLRSIKVAQVMRPDIEIVPPSIGLSDLLSRMTASHRSDFFVVSPAEKSRIKGHICLECIRPILKDYDAVSRIIVADDVMDKNFAVVKPSDSLDMALQLFGKFRMEEIPVVDKGEVVGTVSRNDVIETYNREMFKKNAASGFATSFHMYEKTRPEHMAVLGEFLIREVPAPAGFIDKSLGELAIREKYGATVLTIKRRPEEKGGGYTYIYPDSSTKILKGDIIVTFGLQKDMKAF
jgi:CIC family chloride channel protein